VASLPQVGVPSCVYEVAGVVEEFLHLRLDHSCVTPEVGPFNRADQNSPSQLVVCPEEIWRAISKAEWDLLAQGQKYRTSRTSPRLLSYP
jgi:hypothetical protein